MKRSLIVIALAGCTMLGACGTQNRGLESVHQPVVTRTDYVYDMPAPTYGSRVDERALVGWFESLNLRYGDHVSVDTQGYGAEARTVVGRIAGRYGLLIDRDAPLTQGEIPPGSVRVIVSRMAASVPGCPDWSRPAVPDLDGHLMSNYGCATNTNLALMVADPRDLISGRQGPGTSDGLTSGKAIGAYRRAPPTGTGPLKVENTKGN